MIFYFGKDFFALFFSLSCTFRSANHSLELIFTFHFLRAANFLNFSIFTADSLRLSACWVSFGWRRKNIGLMNLILWYHDAANFVPLIYGQTLIHGCCRLSWIVILFLWGKKKKTSQPFGSFFSGGLSLKWEEINYALRVEVLTVAL